MIVDNGYSASRLLYINTDIPDQEFEVDHAENDSQSVLQCVTTIVVALIVPLLLKVAQNAIQKERAGKNEYPSFFPEGCEDEIKPSIQFERYVNYDKLNKKESPDFWDSFQIVDDVRRFVPRWRSGKRAHGEWKVEDHT